MSRLKRFIIFFCLALSIPTGYLAVHTYRSLEMEEKAELRYFAGSLFDRMESELALLIQKEEAREVDDYTYKTSGTLDPREAYILGYFQNNPDGGFQTPLVKDLSRIPPEKAWLVAKLRDINRIFNEKRAEASEDKMFRPPEMKITAVKEENADIADKYFIPKKKSMPKSYLGRQAKRTEQVTAAQALNVAPGESLPDPASPASDRRMAEQSSADAHSEAKTDTETSWQLLREERSPAPLSLPEKTTTQTFQVEVDPMQSLVIDSGYVVVFRRIVIANQIYRQGFVIHIRPLLRHLLDTHFINQPMARFTHVALKAAATPANPIELSAGIKATAPRFSMRRTFPRPFSFIEAALSCERIPPSAGRATLNVMAGLAAVIFILGLYAIYRSARTVEELSERRSTFVSSVTHELKTPLTNIRMYAEMLDQGIAVDPQREKEYFQVLLSESERLSRLINNVLEFSKLEKKQRKADLEEHDILETIAAVKTIMQEKLRQEGFSLVTTDTDAPQFAFDREMMIQILINLIENSLKFSKNADRREITVSIRPEGAWIRIRVSDTGPGIPPKALSKIFDDFYRVDTEWVRNTRGTGIGLALVKKFTQAMGGTVDAANNPSGGCTITVSLPRARRL